MNEILSKFIPNYKIENIEQDPKLSKRLIMSLIEEKISISSSPFLCSILEYFLKNYTNEEKKYKIILIGERESLNYYSTIGRKFGVNLLKKDNNFIFVDINGSFSKLLSTQLPLEEEYPETFSIVRKKEEEFIECNHKLIDFNNMEAFYNDVYQKIKNLINETKAKDKDYNFIVIFDVINNDGMKSFNEFLKFCFANEIGLILSINKEINNKDIVEYIEYLSDIKIRLKNNESGFSKDLTGIMDILIRMDEKEKLESFRYNLQTNNIKIFNHIEI